MKLLALVRGVFLIGEVAQRWLRLPEIAGLRPTKFKMRSLLKLEVAFLKAVADAHVDEEVRAAAAGRLKSVQAELKALPRVAGKRPKKD